MGIAFLVNRIMKEKQSDKENGMDWTLVLVILGTNTALFFWARSESRQDYRELRQLIDAIHTEMKDFHARLCVIEESKK
jgi:hypothetical protein